MQESLTGFRVAIVEHRYAEQFARLIEKHGAEVRVCPLVQETPVEDAGGALRFIELCTTTRVDILVFYTGVGVDFLFRASPDPHVLERSTILARGPKAVNALRRAGVRVDLVAESPTTEGILRTLERVDLAGKSVLIQLYGRENPELIPALEARGAKVTGVPLYQYSRASDPETVSRLLHAIEAGEIDAIAFTSAPQIRFLLEAARAAGSEATIRKRLQDDIVVASIGEVTTRAILSEGVTVAVQPEDPKMGPMAAALAAHFAGGVSRKV